MAPDTSMNLHALDRIAAVHLPDVRGWYKMVTLVEISGRFFMREGASHSEGLRRLLAELSDAGLKVEESRSLRGQWQAGSWDRGAPVLRVRPSDAGRGEVALWQDFFARNPLGVTVVVEPSLEEARDD